VKFYFESAMAVIHGAKSKLAAMKIRTKKDAEESVSYGLGLLHWGQFQNVEEKKFKYWYWGKWRTKFAYVWDALWQKPGTSRFLIEYSSPCSGCSKCRKISQTNRWSLFSLFGFKSQKIATGTENKENIENENCGKIQEFCVETGEILMFNNKIDVASGSKTGPRCLNVLFAAKNFDRTAFVSEGFRRENEGFPNWLLSDSFASPEKLLQAQKIILQSIVDEKKRKFVAP